jgi:CubicO group peptidase (beta-lactamase class C family)
MTYAVNKIVAVALIAVQCILLRPTAAQEKLPAPTRQVDQLVQRFMEKHGVPGMSVTVARQNTLVYARGVGLADVEHAVPATELTRYRTASVAKPLTAAVVLSLMEEGKSPSRKPIQDKPIQDTAGQWGGSPSRTQQVSGG